MSAEAGAGKLQDRTKKVIGPVAKRLWKFDLQGFDRLPAEGPAILCPNHVSFLDSAFLMLSLPRRISFVGKAEYMDSWKTKFLFPAMGMIPIDRSGGAKSMVALEVAEDVLRRGELFGIFPEGTRSRDGFLYKGRTGAARLAQTIGCPIYPVGIVGTREIQPPDAKLPKLRKPCSITIGRPVRVRGKVAGRMAFRQAMDEVMYEISQITGQKYHDVYAGSKSETEVAVAATVGHVGDQVGEPVLVGAH